MIELLAVVTGKTRRGASFTAGVVLWDDVVVEAAPVLRMRRKMTRDQVREHCQREGWEISVVYVMERRAGLEPAPACLESKRSTN